MATLANWFNGLFTSSELGEETMRPTNASLRVRAFANEDIFFYVKRIDNSRLVRKADPAAGGKCWRLFGSVVGAGVLLIGVLLPSAYGLLAGFQVQALRQESERLITDQASLELQEARLLSPARMEALAKQQQFVDPPSYKVIYLESQGSLAMNKH